MFIEFTKPVVIDIGGKPIEVGHIECKVTIEADESVACEDYYISDVAVFGYNGPRRENWSYVTVPLCSRLAREIIAYARDNHRDAMNDVFRDHRSEVMAGRADRLRDLECEP